MFTPINIEITSDKISYSIIFSKNSDELINQIEKNTINFEKRALIIDRNIAKYYKDFVEKLVKLCKINIVIKIKADERNKNIKTVYYILDKLFENNFNRKSIVLGLGGGIIGDITGFASSIFERGIKYINIPTTLLSMTDSSVGGKTAVNNNFGKNLVGSFHQPYSVYIDTNFLNSLNKREFLNGLAEIIKYGIINDRSLFEILYKNYNEIISRKFNMDNIIYRSCEIKAQIVMLDEKEISLRKILNFGHTIGHGIEKATSYRIPHGYAVMYGIAGESYYAYKYNYLNKNDFELIIDIFKRYNYNIYKFFLKKINIERFINALLKDKKNEKSSIVVVLPEKIGKMNDFNDKYTKPINREDIYDIFNYIKDL